MLAGDLLLSCYMESSPGFVPHIKTAVDRYCSGEGMEGAAGGVPAIPIALGGGRRDEGHRIRLLQGLAAPVIWFFCPNSTHLPSGGICYPRLASPGVVWGQQAACHRPHRSCWCPHRSCWCPHGSCWCPHGSRRCARGPVGSCHLSCTRCLGMPVWSCECC